MNHTTNLHLPQWEADDRILRTDFNEAMASIDAALAAMPVQKLMDFTTTAEKAQIDIDLSSTNLSGFSTIKVILQTYCKGFSVRLNNLTGSYKWDNSSDTRDSLVQSCSDNYEYPRVAELTLLLPSHISGQKGRFGGYLFSCDGDHTELTRGTCEFSSNFTLQNINFIANNNGSFAAGTHFCIFAA